MEQEIVTASAAADDTPPPYEIVALRVGRSQLGAFFPLLQGGVAVQAVVGCTLREFLCDQLAIPADYVTGRITTIFLDNSPVDNLDAVLREGARLTLSAAMPGLVGAVMRRSGYYAALREGITHVERGGTDSRGKGTVRLKLFNLLLEELGPLILARGVMLERKELQQLLRKLSTLWVASSYPRRREEGGLALLTVTFKG